MDYRYYYDREQGSMSDDGKGLKSHWKAAAIGFVTVIVLSTGALITPVSALSAKACSVKYRAAMQAGTLNGQEWNDFRKAECAAASDVATNTATNPVAAGTAKPVT